MKGIHSYSVSGMFSALMKGKARHGHAWLPKRRARHHSSQMKFFSKAKPVRRGSYLSWR